MFMPSVWLSKLLLDLQDSIKYTDIFIMGVLEIEKREKGKERVFEEIMVKTFLI